VEPKRLSLEAANQQLAAAEERLRAVQNKIAALEEALVKLKAEYTRATDAKLRCQVNSHNDTRCVWLAAGPDIRGAGGPGPRPPTNRGPPPNPSYYF